MRHRTLLAVSSVLLLSAVPAREAQHAPLLHEGLYAQSLVEPGNRLANVHAPAVKHELGDLIPADAFMAFRWDDPAGMIANGGDSGFVKFFTDPRWADAFDLDSEEGPTEEEWNTIKQSLAGISEIVVWAEAGSFMEAFDDAMTMGAMMRGEAEALDALVHLLPELQEVSTQDGATLYTAEDTTILRAGNWCGMTSVEDEESAPAMLKEWHSQLTAEELPKGFFEAAGMQADRATADFEMAMNLSFLWEELAEEAGDEMPPSLQAEFESIAWVYASITLGEGNQSEWSMVMPFYEDGLMAGIMGAMTAPKKSDYGRIPKDAISASAINLDLQAMIDVVIDVVSEFVPDVEDQYDMALAQGSEAIGADIQEDLLDQIEGTFITFTMGEASMDIAGIPGYGSTFLMDVHDKDRVLDVIDGVFNLLSMMGMGDEMFEQQETETATSWLINVEDMMELVLGCDASSMFFSMDTAGLDAYHALKSEPSEEQSLLAHGEVLAILEAFDEVPMSIMQINGTFRMFGETMEAAFEIDNDPDVEEIANFFGTLTEIADEHLTGWLGYTMEISSNRARIVAKTR